MLFEQFWKRISNANGSLDLTKLEKIQQEVTAKKGGVTWPECFKDKKTKAGFRACFNNEVANMKRILAGE